MTMERMIRNEYVHNKRLRDYVDRYAKSHEISANEALDHELVRQAFLMYTDV